MRPCAVGQRVGQAAGLRALAAIGAAPGVGVADVALAAVGHAQRAMHEEFQRAGGFGGDRANLAERQFARQHDLREADVLQEARLGRRADVGLRAGVQLDRRQVDFEQAHVLHDQRIGAGLVDLPDQLARLFDLVVAQDGVERDEHLRAVAMRVPRQPLDVGHRVAGIGPRAEGRSADVDGVGAMVDRRDAEIGVLRGRKQFQMLAIGLHWAA